MTRRDAIPTLAILAFVAGAGTARAETPPAPVALGVDMLFEARLDLIAGRRVGLVTHPAAVDRELVATADRFARDPRIDLVQLFAPEHGLRGVSAAGEHVDDGVDAATGVPVEALFGQRVRPSARRLAGLDVLVIDLQDVGSRTYTFASTLGEALTAAAAAHVPVVVLDRPNPLGGELTEGPVRAARFKSFVGWGAVPVTHGLTLGELARFYNAELALGCDLTVVPMRGWRRAMTWADTGLPWVPTSPGIPRAESAPLYVATGMFAGVSTNVNEGVGTTQPFELLGASFVDAEALTRALSAAELPGVRFRAAQWRPYYQRFRGQTLSGVQLVVTDPHAFAPLHTALTLLTTFERLYPGASRFRSAGYVARIWGVPDLPRQIRAGATVASLEASWASDLATFRATRIPYLIYE